MEGKFGKQITRDQGSAYFRRYVRIRNKYCKKLKASKLLDAEGERFFTGRLKASDPVGEDLVYVFDPASVRRLLEQMEAGKFDSLVVFMGTREEENADLGETNGRPTILMFPAKKEVTKDGSGYTLGDQGEEHPGSGGGGTGTGTGIRIETSGDEVYTEIPAFLSEDAIYPIV